MTRLLVLLSLPMCLPGATGCRLLDSDRIHAGDLAAIEASFAGMDGARDIGPAPLPGVQRVFRAEEIQRIARQFGIAVPPLPREVCFERVSQSLTPEALQPVLAESFNQDGVRIEILDVSRFAVASGKIEFPRAMLAPSGLWRGRVVYPEGRSASIWARIRVLDAATGTEVALAAPLASKTPVAPKQVERGDTVRVELAAGGVLLGFDASAETAGRAGDLVIVKNPANGRRFQARVEESRVDNKRKVTVNK